MSPTVDDIQRVRADADWEFHQAPDQSSGLWLLVRLKPLRELVPCGKALFGADGL
jgi:hypothetical protein